jgi:hypothetical protein
MEISSTKNCQKKAGFALLMTLIVVGAVAAIGISVLDLSLKQVQLSTNAKDSEIAFHAANAGMECGRYIRRIASSTMESGGALTLLTTAPYKCFGVSATTNDKYDITTGVSGDGTVTFYKYRFSWGTSPRCTVIETVVLNATPGLSGLTFNGVNDWIQGYPSDNKVCAAGERCTVISTRGWNRSCGDISSAGTVQREVLLQF